MKEQKKGSPLGTLWSWGKAHHGKFVFSIILAILGVACQMIPYFCVVNVISKMFAGETAFSAYLPVCLVALTGYCGKVLFSNLSTVISHNAAYSTLRDLRERVVEKLAKVPMGTILDTPSGHYRRYGSAVCPSPAGNDLKYVGAAVYHCVPVRFGLADGAPFPGNPVYRVGHYVHRYAELCHRRRRCNGRQQENGRRCCIVYRRY